MIDRAEKESRDLTKSEEKEWSKLEEDFDVAHENLKSLRSAAETEEKTGVRFYQGSGSGLMPTSDSERSGA